MKRTERHHLKENEVAEWLLGVKEWYEANTRLVSYGTTALLVMAAAIVGVLTYQRMNAGRATAMLAEAMAVAEAPIVAPAVPEGGKTPVQRPGTYPTDRARLEASIPRLLAVADAYPGTEAGIMARYRAAAALVGVGRTADGIQRYKEVIERGKGAYQAMARLGLADAQVIARQYDQAIASFNEVSTMNRDDVPGDGVLMHLARAYQLAGKPDDAKKAFKRVVDEYPQSPYVAAARKEVEPESSALPR